MDDQGKESKELKFWAEQVNSYKAFLMTKNQPLNVIRSTTYKSKERRQAEDLRGEGRDRMLRHQFDS